MSNNQDFEVQSTFTIPYTQVSNDVIDAEDFEKPLDKLVYISLLRFAFHKGHAFPSLKRLMKMNAVSKNTLLKSLKRLEIRKLISIKQRKENNINKSNIYYIHQYEPKTDESNEDGSSNGVVQKMNHPSSKNERGVVQKMNQGSSKNEHEEKEFNNKTINNNLSKDQEINQIDLPSSIKNQLHKNKDRLIDDSINIHDIELIYKANKNRVTDFQMAHIMKVVLEETKGSIKNIKNLLYTAINNYLSDIRNSNEYKNQSRSNEVLPDWFKDRKKQESSNKTGYSKYDLSKGSVPEWVESDSDVKDLLDSYMGNKQKGSN